MQAGQNALTQAKQAWTAGQVIGLIHDVPTCDELVKRIEREAIETLQKSQSLYVDDVPKPDQIAGKGADQVQSGKGASSGKPNPGAQVWGIEKGKL